MASGIVNDYVTTLSGAIDSSQTTLAVNDAPPTELGSDFWVRIDDEFLRVTPPTTPGATSWTVVRAADESSRFPAAAHADGADVSMVMTRRSLFGLPRAPLMGVAPLYVPGAAPANLTVTDKTYMMPILLPSHMYVATLMLRVATAGAGTVQWGLFDYAYDPQAAVKVAGGSGALNATGMRPIGASPAGTRVPAGGYALVIKFPSSGAPVISSSAIAASVTGVQNVKEVSAAAWTDTPNLLFYNASTAQPIVWLQGSLSGPLGEPPSFTYSW